MITRPLRLGVNIDHVATVRNARGGVHPDPVAAALLAQDAGADGITAHLREDRRHVRDDDMWRLKTELKIPLNFEMAATDEMVRFACTLKPHACCLVPEKREELTTEGGLDILKQYDMLTANIFALKEAGIRVSLFIDASLEQIDAAKKAGADIVELHTGAYCEATGSTRSGYLSALEKAAAYAHGLGLECHAGHGLNYDTVSAVAAIPQLVELNIGHFLIGESIFHGLEYVVKRMRALMNEARR